MACVGERTRPESSTLGWAGGGLSRRAKGLVQLVNVSGNVTERYQVTVREAGDFNRAQEWVSVTEHQV